MQLRILFLIIFILAGLNAKLSWGQQPTPARMASPQTGNSFNPGTMGAPAPENRGTQAVGANPAVWNDPSSQASAQPNTNRFPVPSPTPTPEAIAPSPFVTPQSSSQQTFAPATVTAPVTDSRHELHSMAHLDHPLKDVMAVERPDDSVVQGKDLFLYELLAGVSSPEARRVLLHEYWGLTEKYLTYKYRLVQLYLLYDKIAVSFENDPELKPQIELAITQVEKLQKAAELEFIQAQYVFSEVVKRYTAISAFGNSNSSGLFIPVDYPLVITYNTKSEQLAQQARTSAKAKLLDKTIPLQYQVVLNRRDACQAAEQYLQSLLQNRRSPIQALSTCIQERIELLHAIVSYNDQIADYVAETVRSDVTGKSFLSAVIMLPRSTSDSSPSPSPNYPGVSQAVPVSVPQDQNIQNHNSIVQVSAVAASHVVPEEPQSIATPTEYTGQLPPPPPMPAFPRSDETSFSDDPPRSLYPSQQNLP